MTQWETSNNHLFYLNFKMRGTISLSVGSRLIGDNRNGYSQNWMCRPCFYFHSHNHLLLFPKLAVLCLGQRDFSHLTDPSDLDLTLSLNGCKMNINYPDNCNLRLPDEFKQSTIQQRDFHQYSLYLKCSRADMQSNTDINLAENKCVGMVMEEERQFFSLLPALFLWSVGAHADVCRSFLNGKSSSHTSSCS